MEREPSSVTKSEPSGATATPTGRPQTSAVGRDEAGEEVFVLAGGVAVVHGQADDFVAGALGAVP